MEHKRHEVFISFSFKDQRTVDTILNHLTNVYQIPCWICTEQIRAGENFRDDIVEAIDACKIIVFVQSKTSAISQEVSDEILYGLSIGKIVMPFKIEESVLKPAMRMKFHSTHYIDATVPTLEERIKELAKDICRTLGRPLPENLSDVSAAPKAKLLPTPSVMPKKVFVGRADVMEKIGARFQDGDRVLFLQGIGGIGKTQIAKQYAKQFRDRYDTIIYATYTDSIRATILSDAAFRIEPPLVRYTVSDGTQEDDDAFFDRKLSVIQKLATDRTLIILDNFDVEADGDLPKLMEGNYHLLITTRCDYSRYYPTVKIHSIDSPESLKAVFLQNYDGYDVDEDDPKLIELIRLVNCHTYTIELLAQHMENSGQTVEEMIAALKREGILSLNEEVRNANMETKVAYENLLKMFKLFSLTEEQKQILMYLCSMPTDGVRLRDFKLWSACPSPKPIKALETSGWIVKNGDSISMHPIIRDVVRHEIPLREEAFADFLRRFSETITDDKAWHFKKTDKDYYGNIGKALIACFPVISQITEPLYYQTEALLSFAVQPDYAVVLAEELYRYFLGKYGAQDYRTGRSAYKLGWAYAYNNHLPNALEQARIWLSKANEIFEKLELSDPDQIAAYTQTTVNLAKVYSHIFRKTKNESDYDLAIRFAECSVARTTEAFLPGSPFYARVAGARWQLADVLYENQNYEEALAEIEVALDILVGLYSYDNADTSGALHRKASVIYALGRSQEAKELAQFSSQSYADYFGRIHPRTCAIYELLGDCCAALQQLEEALAAYRTAREIAEQIYSPEAQQRTQLLEKLKKMDALL